MAAPAVHAGAAAAGEDAVLITGGAGFVGTNLAHRLASEGRRVLIYDNLSRPGVERNLQWLIEQHGPRIQPVIADIRDAHALRRCVDQVDQVFHLAAQVAVTTSLADPLDDFEVNARGAINLLEAIRTSDSRPSLLFTSTNKVYGGLQDVEFRPNGSRYEPCDGSIRRGGIGEDRPLDFHSPYGCSKGAADQYVIDYARSFGLRAVVFRMSCIYGPHQFGTEDQGWVAHFLIRAIQRKPITLYGDGMQVRDILFVEDLVQAMCRAQERMGTLSGQAFNIGGGCDNTVSLLELLDMIQLLTGRKVRVNFDSWRVGDQRYYVSDASQFRQQAQWAPQVGVVEGVARLYEWLVASRTAVAPSTVRDTILLPPPEALAPARKLVSWEMPA